MYCIANDKMASENPSRHGHVWKPSKTLVVGNQLRLCGVINECFVVDCVIYNTSQTIGRPFLTFEFFISSMLERNLQMAFTPWNRNTQSMPCAFLLSSTKNEDFICLIFCLTLYLQLAWFMYKIRFQFGTSAWCLIGNEFHVIHECIFSGRLPTGI